MSTTSLPRVDSGRRLPTAFPAVPVGPPTAPPDAGAGSASPLPALAWEGEPGPLADMVRDHAQASGLVVTSLASAEPAHLRVLVSAAGSGHAPPLPNLSDSGVARILVTDGPPTEDTWREALACGARSVRELPRESSALLADLGAIVGTGQEADVLVCVPGSGGAGATSLAARLARAASRVRLAPLLVDTDPLAGGIDTLIDAAHVPGARWDALERAGDGSAAAIRASLPLVDGIRLLTFSHDPAAPTPPPGVRARVLGALAAEPGLLIIDAPAGDDAWIDLSPRTVLVTVEAAPVALASARRRVAQLRARLGSSNPALALALRHPRSHRFARAAEVEAEIGAPVALEFASSPPSQVPVLDTRRRGADRACLQFMRGLP
ncbi:MAG: hypothetical protein Q4G21_05480 [Dermabacter sp.]|nr:hypothetical protein [Dermabacter sp.]